MIRLWHYFRLIDWFVRRLVRLWHDFWLNNRFVSIFLDIIWNWSMDVWIKRLQYWFFVLRILGFIVNRIVGRILRSNLLVWLLNLVLRNNRVFVSVRSLRLHLWGEIGRLRVVVRSWV